MGERVREKLPIALATVVLQSIFLTVTRYLLSDGPAIVGFDLAELFREILCNIAMYVGFFFSRLL